jgi:S1-C subfamily serine protease
MPALLLVLATLLLLLILPSVVEQVEYGLTRGRERARAEVAGQQLRDFPDLAQRYPLIVKRILPSVVAIETVQAGRETRDEFVQVFAPQRIARGLGSGVIMDPAGYILTNYHVVHRAVQITVMLSDGRKTPGEVVGRDPASDLAVVKIESDHLMAAAWGDSDKLEVGDQVLAVGSPFGLSQTVTAGIVSAKNREGVVGNVAFGEFLQTDAAVNHGNSGGPLVNMQAEVVGINTAIVGPAYQGVSFAIPSRLAHEMYDRLKTEGGTIARGWLGVAMADVDQSIADRLGLEEPGGVYVSRVMPGSPADKAGIQAGDVIVKWNKEPADSSDHLRLVVVRSKIGAKVPVTVFRGGRTLPLTVTIGPRPGPTE